jgi:hypothetical protein
MNEMIERVARKMGAVLLPQQEHYAVGDLNGTVFSYVDVQELDMADLARAAIEAMREPTDEMLNAAVYAESDLTRAGHRSVYRAMINAALS